jgi:alkyl hydroperoxide reductase subunit AhpC
MPGGGSRSPACFQTRRLAMSGPLPIGSNLPDFTAMTTEGPIRFHEWLGDSLGVLVSHPKDFTPVCTTELGYMARIKPEFDRRGVKIIGLSVDPVESHRGWPAVSQAEAKERYAEGWTASKPYLRYVPQPRS